MGLIANVTWGSWPQLNETPGKAFVVVTKMHSLCTMSKQFNRRGGSHSG